MEILLQEDQILSMMKGSYSYHTENRLSEIFSATFNGSERFRKLICKLFNLEGYKNLRSRTQVHYDNSKSIIDILIQNKEQIECVVENKTESELTYSQLNKYTKLFQKLSVKKIAIVKYYFGFESNQWNIIRWNRIHRELANSSQNDLLETIFKKYLEDNGMGSQSVIRINSLNNIADLLFKIGAKNRTHFVLNDNNAITNMNELMEFSFEISAIISGGKAQHKLSSSKPKFSYSNNDVKELEFYQFAVPVSKKRNGKETKYYFSFEFSVSKSPRFQISIKEFGVDPDYGKDAYINEILMKIGNKKELKVDDCVEFIIKNVG